MAAAPKYNYIFNTRKHTHTHTQCITLNFWTSCNVSVSWEILRQNENIFINFFNHKSSVSVWTLLPPVFPSENYFFVEFFWVFGTQVTTYIYICGKYIQYMFICVYKYIQYIRDGLIPLLQLGVSAVTDITRYHLFSSTPWAAVAEVIAFLFTPWTIKLGWTFGRWYQILIFWPITDQYQSWVQYRAISILY